MTLILLLDVQPGAKKTEVSGGYDERIHNFSRVCDCEPGLDIEKR